MGFSEKENEVLDRIIRARHSVRSFKEEMPPRKMIEEIIEAGIYAPYGALGRDPMDRQYFYVIERNSATMKRLSEMMIAKIKAVLGQMEGQAGNDPKAEAFLNRLRGVAKHGVKGVGNAPYLIIIAERRGIPAVETQTIAHCMQNMWLKATALGLGMHPVSGVGAYGNDKEFLDLIGIPPDQFALDACAVGYPKGETEEDNVLQGNQGRHRPVGEVTTWIK